MRLGAAPLVALAASAPPRLARAVRASSLGLGWPQLLRQLDETPVFTVVDEACCAIEYGGAPFEPRSQFYIDAADAEAELAAAEKRLPGMQLHLQAVGLGFAFARCGGDALGQAPAAVLVPSARALERARATGATEDWDDPAAVPLFGSSQLQRRERSGRTVTPLFFDAREAEAALAEAPGDPIDLVAISLKRMAAKIADGDLEDPRSMRFCAPRTSGVLCKSLEAAAGGAPMGASDDGVARQALTAIFNDGRQRSQGLFPE